MRRLARPLPLSIAAMLLLGGVKLSGLVHAAWPAGAALASGHPAPAAAPAKGHGAPPAPAAPPPAAAPAAPSEPPVSEAERTVLQELRARRTQLDGRAEALDSREAMLAAAERRLSERIAQLSSLQARLEQLDGSRRERDEQNWRGLVKTYEAMRPKDAAAILADMETPLLVQVLDRMKEAKVAPILAAMPPDRARVATAQLAQWRSRGTAAGSPAGTPG